MIFLLSFPLLSSCSTSAYLFTERRKEEDYDEEVEEDLQDEVPKDIQHVCFVFCCLLCLEGPSLS